ncbi:MAG: hypothetical protein ACE5GX_19375 [Thermoanaerobaculia bacterium]
MDTFVEQVFADLSWDDFLPLKDVRAELLPVGQSILRLARDHRPIRVLLRNEGSRNSALARRMPQLNTRFHQRCLLWLRRTIGEDLIDEENARVLSLLVFGPLLYYMLELDIRQRAFDLPDRDMLQGWANFWAEKLRTDERS